MYRSLILFLVITIFIMLSMLLIVAWVYKDAKSRGLNAELWVLIILCGGFLGLIIYIFIGRKENKLDGDNVKGGNIPLIGCLVGVCLVVGLIFAIAVMSFVSFSSHTSGNSKVVENFYHDNIKSEGFSFEYMYDPLYFENSARKMVKDTSNGDTWTVEFKDADAGYSFDRNHYTKSNVNSASINLECEGSIQIMITQNGLDADDVILETISQGEHIFDLTNFDTGYLNFKIININAKELSIKIVVE